MKLLWLKPNRKGVAIFISIFVILAFLFCFFDTIMATGEVEHYENSVFSHSIGKVETNRIFLRLIIVALALCYLISTYIGSSISLRPGLSLCSVSTAVFFLALAGAGLVSVAMLEIAFSLPGTFFLILTGMLSIPIIGLLLTLLRKLHTVAFTIIAVASAGLLCAALLWIYYSRPLIPLFYLAAIALAAPFFVLVVLQFKKTALTLYALFLVTLGVIYHGPLGVRHSFLRDLDSIKRGMTYAEAEKIMEKYSYRKGFRHLDNFSVKCLVPVDTNVVPLAAGPNHLIVVKSDGSLAGWGRKQSGERDFPSGNDYVAVGAGCSYSAALKSDGSLAAWGSNESGRCDIPLGNNYVAIAAGYSHIVSLKSNGSLVARGRNDAGQCNVPKGNHFTSISAGGRHSLALRSNGSLIAWGSNDYGQCDVPEGKDFASIAAGGSHSLALKSDGSLMAWGNRLSPWRGRYVPAGHNFVAIAAGVEHNVALRSDGSLIAWGDNIYGQCNVPTGQDFVAITAGWYESAALKSDGSLISWGSTYTTGIGSFENRHKSELVNGTVLYRYDNNNGNSDVGRIRFRDDRVESVIFWAD